MISLTWGQVNAWRLSQQGLSHRLMADGLLQVISQTMGIHAQVMSAAEMAIAARVDGLSPDRIHSALWQEHKLIKTWMMRQTLHLVPSSDFPLFIAARRATDINWPELFNRHGISKPIFEAYVAATPEILDGKPLTRRQFAEAVNERVKSPELYDFMVKGTWGQAFKPLAWRGELCFGPGTGQDATFVQPRAWIGDWHELDPQSAIQQIVRRYLMVYGPTRQHNFQWWWWTSSAAVKNAFNSIADEIEEVDVEGWRAIGLKDALQSMLELEPSGEAHLLPPFDAYVVGLPRGKDVERLISTEVRKQVFSQQGWVSAVVLVDGFIKGTWDYKVTAAKCSITIKLFSPISEAIKEKIAHEAERYGKYLNSPVFIEFRQD